MGYSSNAHLGSWLSDAIGWAGDVLGGGSDTPGPPGWHPGGTLVIQPGGSSGAGQTYTWAGPGSNAIPPGARKGGQNAPPDTTDGQPGVSVTQGEADDLGTIAAWVQSVKDSGSVPTRVPGEVTLCGLTQCPADRTGRICQRINGPYTNHPDAVKPYTYVLAPDDVLEADARVRANDVLAQALGAIIPPEVIPLNNFLQSITTNYLPILLGIAGLVVVFGLRSERR